jgi:tetratricopeptide (TPR) repeat protein
MEKLLQKKKNSVAALYTTDSIAFKHYQDSIQLKMEGKWRDAGDKLIQCADLYLFLRMSLEAATIYTEAAECFLKVDKSEALRAYASSVKTYCEVGKFTVAGQLERKIAMIHYRIQHYEDAAAHFQKAANFLSGDKNFEQSELCLEKAASCYVHIGEYRQAFRVFEDIAGSCAISNLRRFEARSFLMLAVICLMGEIVPTAELEKRPGSPLRPSSAGVPGMGAAKASDGLVMIPLSYDQLQLRYINKYSEVEMKIREYESIDFLWKSSRHQKLLSNLLKYRRERDLHSFIDHMYYWNAIEQWNEISLILLQNTVAELQLEISLIAANEADTVSVVSVSLASIASDISDGRRSSANRDSVNQQNAAKKKK